MNKKYLIDTNVWLELLLNNANANDVRLFFTGIAANQLYISQISLNAIHLYFYRQKKSTAFTVFINDLFIKNNVNCLSLAYFDYEELAELTDEVDFDFDDAYHYLLAKTNDLELISFNTELSFEDISISTPALALLDSKQN